MARKDSNILPQTINNEGHPTVELEKGGQRITKRVDELVAETFLGPCPPGHVLRHKDGDLANCRADNLEYVRGE